jgi:TonB family protein
MRLSVASSALAVAFVLTHLAAGYAPALGQDFSITNQEAPANPGHRDLMRQLQAWWDLHAYYPKAASQKDQGGTVKVHLVIHPDGNIWMVDVEGSSASPSLDKAGALAFRGGFVRPFPEGAPDDEVDIFLHYVLARRHDQPVPAGYTPVSSRSPFTITSDPVKSPILEAMSQRTCTGTVVRQGVRNHPMYGVRSSARAVFFRRPDGTPWVKFDEGGFSTLAPVEELGKTVQWTGREERIGKGASFITRYTVWSDGDNTLNGKLGIHYMNGAVGADSGINHAGIVDFTCATEVVPAIEWKAWAVSNIIQLQDDPD